MVDDKLVRPAAAAVIAVKLTVALSFLAWQLPRYGAVLAACLLTAFAAVIVSARVRRITAFCKMSRRRRRIGRSPRTFMRIAFLGTGVALVLVHSSASGGAPSISWWAATIVTAACVTAGCAALTEVPAVLRATRGGMHDVHSWQDGSGKVRSA